MSKRTLIAAGNWKMNKTYEGGIALAQALVEKTPTSENLVILGVPFTHLKGISKIISGYPHFKLAAQNCHQEEKGAYTGEISADMLLSVGVEFVILGHSERRQFFNEDNELLAQKVNTVLTKGLIPIFCCGEPLEIREAKTHVDYVKKQLEEGLFHLDAASFSNVVIAYEPIWAIGTGVTASKEQAQEMHREIRTLITNRYGDEIAQRTSILYGGSVKPDNASELFAQPDVDGGLVGGASLKADDFVKIIESF